MPSRECENCDRPTAWHERRIERGSETEFIAVCDGCGERWDEETDEPEAFKWYQADSLDAFLKYYTDGDIGHGGCRYACPECNTEDRCIVDSRAHLTGFEYAPPCDIQERFPDKPSELDMDVVYETVDVIRFDENGYRVETEGAD